MKEAGIFATIFGAIMLILGFFILWPMFIVGGVSLVIGVVCLLIGSGRYD